jgi:pyruvate-formate lyase-activating enzyme
MNNDCYRYLLAAVQENVLPLTSRCNVSCIFCSNRQNPPTVITHRLPVLPLTSVLELAAFLDPRRKVIIGESATRLDEGEPFTHPEIMVILQNLRRLLPQTTLAVTTNGTLLTPPMVQTLVELQPLELTISLNSATARGRYQLMGDRAPERVWTALHLIKRAKLPFHGSLVAMPHQVGWSDTAATVRCLAEHGALTIRVFLPGYTKYAPPALQFPLNLWSEVITRAQEWTRQYNVPVIPEPYLPEDLMPSIWGVMQNTPAQSAGLLPEDVILAVNRRSMRTRVEAFQTVEALQNPLLTIKRGEQITTIKLHKAAHQAPGFVMLYDFAPRRAAEIDRAVKRFRAAKTLLLASEFAYYILQQAAAKFALPSIVIRPVVNHFFGGSIKAAGLLVVADMLAAAQEALTSAQYDLLLVPREAFDSQLLDLTGQAVHELENALSLPVQAV